MLKVNCSIRSAAKDDLQYLMEILKQTGLYWEPMDGSVEFYQAQLEDDSESILVAECDEKIVAMILFVYSPLWSSVGHLAVLQNYRRLGIGKALFKEVINRINKRGCRDIACYVEEANSVSLGLCDNIGLKKYPKKLFCRYKDIYKKQV
jgi:ribosomal protein S18 acetylase RimI-like enzyme